jgi:type II secretory pathway pseudopilin PulG
LLSHALLETWKRRAGHVLTLKGYAEAGGVHGAIAHTAESVYQNLTPEEQGIARDIFLRLTELGEGTEDTRRRASFDELMSDRERADEVRQVLNMLADARLVTLNEDSVEVAHEALIREWPTLREWLNQDREGLQLHRRLTEGAHEWELLERDPGVLFRGTQLAQAREWAVLHPSALNAGEKSFLESSNLLEQNEITEREAQQKRELEAAQKLAVTERQSVIRLRLRNRVITGVGVVTILLAVIAFSFSRQSNVNAANAEKNAQSALNAQATAQMEARNRAAQQAVAESNFARAEAQRLALEANRLILSQGSPEQIALLTLRSMETQHTPEGDAVLAAASKLNYPRQLFKGHSDSVSSVAYSPDGKYVLTSSDKTASLWDAKTGTEIHQFIHTGG